MAEPVTPSENEVHVISPAGVLGTVPVSQVQQARDAGFSIPTGNDLQTALAKHAKEKKEEQYGDISGMASEIGAAGARGLTLGLSDPALLWATEHLGSKEARESIRERLEGQKEANPITSFVSELSGTLAPLILSAGTSAPAQAAGLTAKGAVKSAIRGAGFLPRAAAFVGEQAEHGVATLVGKEATGIFGKTAQKILPHVALGAVEGPFYGVGHEISESALGDTDLTSEKALAGIKSGAMWGMILGAGVSGLERVGGIAFDALKSKGLPADFSEFISNKAGEKAFKAAGASKKFSSLAEHVPGGAPAIGNELLNIIPEATGKTFGRHSLEEIANIVEAKKNEIGEKIGSTVDELTALQKIEKPVEIQSFEGAKPANDVVAEIAKKHDALGEEVAASADKVTDNGSKISVGPSAKDFLTAGNEYADSVRKKFGFASQAKAIDDALNEFKTIYGESENPMSFKSFWEAQRDFGKKIYRLPSDTLNPTPQKEELQHLRGIMNNLFMTKVEQMSAAAGTEHINLLKGFKEQYRKLTLASDMAQEALERKTANRSISLTDTIAAGSGYAGSMAAHGGAALSGVPGALAMGAVNKFIRTRGDAVAADILHRMSNATQKLGFRIPTTESVVSKLALISGEVDGLITDAVGGATATPSTGKPVVMKGKPFPSYSRASAESNVLQENFAKAASSIKRIAPNQDALAENLSKATQHINAHAPKVSAGIASKASNGVAFLESKLPKGSIDPYSLTPSLDKFKVSDAEAAKFMRYYKAVTEPMSAMRSLKEGHISKEEVEALQAVYPKLYQQITTEILRQVADKKSKIDYQKRLALGTMLGIQTDVTMSHAVLKSSADTYKQSSPQPAGSNQTGGGKGSQKPLHTTKLSASGSDAIEQNALESRR